MEYLLNLFFSGSRKATGKHPAKAPTHSPRAGRCLYEDLTKKCYIRGSIWRFDTKYGILGESYGDLIQNKLHLETFMEIRCKICFIRRFTWRFETKCV